MSSANTSTDGFWVLRRDSRRVQLLCNRWFSRLFGGLYAVEACRVEYDTQTYVKVWLL